MSDNYRKPLRSDYIRNGADIITHNANESYRREESALAAIAEVSAGLDGHTLVDINAGSAGSYQLGSNYRSYPVLAGESLLVELEKIGVPTGTDTRLLVELNAPTAGTYEVGSNYRSRTVGGGVSADYVDSQVQALPDVAQRELLRDRARRITAAPRRTTAKAVVALVADDYPRDTIDHLAPLLKARNLPWSWALNGDTFDSGYSYQSFSTGKTWADVKTLADRDGVEICNHGASHRDVTSISALQAEIVGSRDRLRAETGQDILGFVPPGCDFPEGVNFKSTPLIAREGLELKLVGTAYDQLVNYTHAWATGVFSDPGTNTPCHPLDGSPRMNAGRTWLDAPNNNAIAPGGSAYLWLDKAIELKRGVIFGIHACYMDGASLGGRMTRENLTAWLDRLAQLRDAGTVEVVTMTKWHYTRLD
ncbi:polysaccharide deacetylase family protein [Rothia nasimurium]|uniref:Polysaccharide deacetylase family protein n=1 Tax=Rothia nasimurium TaxID=85336 RepID=A0A4Y9F1Z2_9MICC|nr:polysaccharide deacetylase family protein [Rothia nasimurium]MBF0809124.1 polysaccharide deacetylase family protein [Rothia nasimurium]TFU20646.1 polysaccharide deacetylase family protein [Rothia nasimurium]